MVAINPTRLVEIQDELTSNNTALIEVSDQEDIDPDNSSQESTAAEDDQPSKPSGQASRGTNPKGWCHSLLMHMQC